MYVIVKVHFHYFHLLLVVVLLQFQLMYLPRLSVKVMGTCGKLRK